MLGPDHFFFWIYSDKDYLTNIKKKDIKFRTGGSSFTDSEILMLK